MSAATSDTRDQKAARYPRNAPKGWTISPAYVGWEATHDDFDAEIIDGQTIGNGLSAWGLTRTDVEEQIAEIEAEHPHFTTTTKE